MLVTCCIEKTSLLQIACFNFMISALKFKLNLIPIRTLNSFFRPTHEAEFKFWVQVQAPAGSLAASGNHSRRLFLEMIEGFGSFLDCKINDTALMALLGSCSCLHNLGRSRGQAKTQGVPKSAPVADCLLAFKEMLPILQFQLQIT